MKLHSAAGSRGVVLLMTHDSDTTQFPVQVWKLANDRSIVLDAPRVMAIINCTPDSFHESSRAITTDDAVRAAEVAVEQGADMLDLGGESTSPGADRIDAAEQIRRVVPAIQRIRASGGRLGNIPISIDTTLSSVAQAALDAGADAINDVSGGQDDPAVLGEAAKAQCGLVLMHRLRPPQHDQFSDAYEQPPEYSDVVESVRATLSEATRHALEAGVLRESIVWDPGLGFGKGLDDTIALIQRTGGLLVEGYPLLSATSRKSFVGRLSLGRDSEPSERLAGSIAFSIAHLWHGVRLFRVHDVGVQREALAAAWALLRPRGRG